MGPRVTFRHKGGTYIAGGISEHLRHYKREYSLRPCRLYTLTYQVLAVLLRAAQAIVLYGTALQMAIWLSAYYATLRISHKESAIAPSSVFIQQPLCLRWGSGIIQSRAIKVSVQLLIMVILI